MKTLFKALLILIVGSSLIKSYLINFYKDEQYKYSYDDEIIFYRVNEVYLYESCIPILDSKIGIHKESTERNSSLLHFTDSNYIKKENRESVILWIGDIDFDNNIEIFIYDYINKKDIVLEITNKNEILIEKNKLTILGINIFINIGFLTLSNFWASFMYILGGLDMYHTSNFYADYWNG